MNIFRFLTTLTLMLGLATGLAKAAPGAHGPNGEHLDTPAAGSAAAVRPRVQAQSDQFELVAELHDTELSILIDRFDTNEPVTGAKVEVQSGRLKAVATFHADHGDYAVDDESLLNLLKQPGEHALIFTIVAGSESDLLDGTLVNSGRAKGSAAGHGHHHDGHLWERLGIALLILAVLAGGARLFWRRRAAGPRSGAGQASMAALATGALLLGLMAALSSPAWAAPGAHGPNGEHLDAPGGNTNGSGLGRLPDGSVNVPKMAQRRMAIRTLLAPLTEASATVELPARVVVDPNAGGRVQAVHGGRLEPGPQGLPFAGQPVQQGQVLAYVRHHAEPFAVGAQQAQLSELRTQRALAEQRVQRLQALEGTVPRKEIEAARAEAAGLAERERSIGQSLQAREALVAPVNGVIAQAQAVVGQVVEPREVLFEVVDPQRLMVEATTADATLASRIAQAAVKDQAGVRLALRGSARALRDGVLSLMFSATPSVMPSASAPSATPTTSAPTREPLPLVVGQPVTVVAQLKERVEGVVLPAQAVVRNAANEPVVWIKSGAERFVPQPVQLRSLDAATVVITQGLAPDNRVVVQGAPLIAQIR
jgi:cobalt-zinc-cadmium efflux system membrane fusion protein